MKNTNKKMRHKSAVQRHKKIQGSVVSKLIFDAQEYFDQNQLDQANYLFQQVLQLEPENILALNALALIAMQAGMLTQAVELLNIACEINPQHLTVKKNLALAYTRMSRYDEAILQYTGILDIEKNNSDAHGELARLNLQSGNLDIALNHYRRAFELNPEDPRNLHGIVQLDVNTVTEDDINKVENFLRKQDLPLDKRSSFYFALGNIYDRAARFDEAFANYSVANICKGSKFDNEKHSSFISNIINTFSAEFFENQTNSELNGSNQPVFIVGMPRSGTTLVEQILASHSNVYAAGEINLISHIAQKLGITVDQDQKPSMLPDELSAETLNDLAQFYLNNIKNMAIRNGDKKPLKITNKLPANFVYLGLIAVLFPKARIIHCRRNPLDVCLSCYFQNFAGDHGYANDLKNMGLYYQQYERLMAYWNKVLPIEIHTVDYEEMVKFPQSTSKKLIEFIGLDWQQECNEFYKTKRNVNTASLAQVRKKIYRSSLERWQNYEKYIHLLKKTLNTINYVGEATEISINKTHDMNKKEELSQYLH